VSWPMLRYLPGGPEENYEKISGKFRNIKESMDYTVTLHALFNVIFSTA
jgi:hypothetical protein